MTRTRLNFAVSLLIATLLGPALPAMAHFGMVIPSANIVTRHNKEVDLVLSFSHPFEMIGMDLAKPKEFFVSLDGAQTSLLDMLQQTSVMEHRAWQLNYAVKRPGVYIFVMEPQPYWEPAEDCFIIHYTKTVVAAFGDDAGWDEPIGLPTEIVPLTRPFGNYGGNGFSGQVLRDGRPLSGAMVEVELYNSNGTYSAPHDQHITQAVKADENGIFTFTCPKSGWWGFSALSTADYRLQNNGEEKPVELGAVVWIYLDEYTTR